jgi:hypothetical protein
MIFIHIRNEKRSLSFSKRDLQTFT